MLSDYPYWLGLRGFIHNIFVFYVARGSSKKFQCINQADIRNFKQVI